MALTGRSAVRWMLTALGLTALGLAASACLANQADAEAPPVALPAPSTAVVQPALEPPQALTATTVAYPEHAPPHSEPILVRVKLTVGTDGEVKQAELLTRSLPVFDEAVLQAARRFRFSPGRYGGKAVAVAITFSHTFLPPPPPPAAPQRGAPAVDAVLRGKLVEKGTRAPVSGATVVAQVDGKIYAVDADRRGRFRLPLPSGRAQIAVKASGYRAFAQVEEVAAGQEVAIAYYVERDRYDPYEIMVFGEQRREELSRVTLRGPEIKQVPGTFGDPFRVVQALPGVSSVISLLPFPVVRGASPSSTGFLVDGTKVPLLYHLLAGPSVLHPEFIDEMQFFPGGAPVLYGGYTAGIIDGRTRRARADEHLYDVDLNLLQAGALVRHPVPYLGGTATAAARLGYPGTVLSLATDQASLSYWDYQLRFDGGSARNGYTVFAFGASDELQTPAPGTDPNLLNPPLQPSLRLSFHRLDLRAHHGHGQLDMLYRIVGGYDDSLTSPTTGVQTWVTQPQLRARWRPSEQVEWVGGIEGLYNLTSRTDLALANATASPAQTAFNRILDDASEYANGTLLTEALWRPTPRWLVRPGVRVDVRHDRTATLTAVDPRLTARYRVTASDLPADATASQAVWLKAGVGIYHQPPRFFLPLPGLDTMPLRFGLLQSIQSSVGAEIALARDLGLNLEAYYNHMDPVVFDLQVNQPVSNLVQSAPSLLPGEEADTTGPGGNGQRIIDSLFAPQRGRGYGLEVLLRRQARSGPFGWIAYTLSASERNKDGNWAFYDYDRTHLLNVVAGLPLPRNWDIGVRLQYQSGKPTTTTAGYNTARTDGYFRFDVRIDKRAVWNKWLLDFYIDLTNITLFPEEIVAGQAIRYVLPTFGLRGRL
jgi:TonB family protein